MTEKPSPFAARVGCFWVLTMLLLIVTVAVETTLLITR